jgi:hypothetical protein
MPIALHAGASIHAIADCDIRREPRKDGNRFRAHRRLLPVYAYTIRNAVATLDLGSNTELS